MGILIIIAGQALIWGLIGWEVYHGRQKIKNEGKEIILKVICGNEK